ncbi:uncharacterized protein RJT21DRAFT_119788 [Scheffersomyces amazonensis]|uniref:uncharacterized protein n=1 Tax=Scheffersomyces amazonensis TaxID=1078765 RepID=UPI00315CD813
MSETISSSQQPISITEFTRAITELHQDVLESIKKQLVTSLTKLIQTNNELQDEITSIRRQLSVNDTNELELDEDLKLYAETIGENRVVIEEQKSRISAVLNELVTRGLLSDANRIKEEGTIFNELSVKDATKSVDIKKDGDVSDDENTVTKKSNDDDNEANDGGIYL